MKHKRATQIVVAIIKAECPRLWTFATKQSYTDDAGNRIHVRDDGGICWETMAWLDYEVLDKINEGLELEGIPLVAEYSNSYEVILEPV